ncbi:unnamed protein product [Rhizophagus irregularis]|uniref:Uncharacterized protein n=1 Tax=Rhizophagus irregularis TaxID=588596 RepID=A0A915ZL47_9GLOM|nr:unnamed protein product [Rhizophagus irregularis]CAB5380685.1 unnamed protein product [Rhizophagus irregularis]
MLNSQNSLLRFEIGIMDNSKEFSIDVDAEEELPITSNISDKPDKSPRESQILKPDNTKKSLFATIKSWYEPTYVKSLDAPTQEKPKLRYCNGRLTKRRFIIYHILIISFFFTIIFAPVAYYLIIPAFIRYKVQHVDLNEISIDHMDVLEWKSDGLRFSWKATLPKQFFLPLKTKLAALDLTIHDANSNSLLVIGIPEMEVNIGEPITLNFEGDVSFKETSGLKNFLGEISKPDGISDTSLSADTQITVNMWGITWYKNLNIKRTIPIPKMSGNLLDLWNTMPKFLISKDMQSMTLNQQSSDTVIEIGGVNVTNVNKPIVIDGVSYWQILPGFPPINLQSFDIAFTNEGPNISLKAALINPTVLSIPLPDTSIGLQLEDSYLATTSVNGFNLTRGLNNIDLNLKLTFDPSRIVSPNQLSNSISLAAGKLLGISQSNDQLRFNVIGPVGLKGVDFIGDATEKLSLTLPINEIINNTNVMLLKNLFDVKGIESLLHTIHFDVKIQQDRIIIPVDISLPSFLPLPPSLEFKYNTSLGIFKGEQNALTVNLGGISMTNNETLNIVTSVTIFPNNTFEAAGALASIVNPSLSGNISSADIKNFSIFNETGGTFPWANDLFGGLSLNIPIPGFNTTTIINMLTQNGTSIPAEMLGMRLTQRSDVAGFNVNGTVAIKYPPFLPIITIGTGYLESTIFTDDVLLATAKLPNGIFYTAGENSTNIVASAILNKDDRLKSIISQLVMSVLETEDNVKMPIIGISGLKMGASETLSFVTFSQILVPINLATLKPAMKTTIGTISQSIQKQVGLLSLTGVDFAIVTSNSLSINLQTILNNPMNIIADIGSVSFTTTLFYGELANITLSPIQLAIGRNPFNLQMRIDIVDGKNGMSDNILQLFKDLTSTEGDFRSIIGIKNFIIAPPPPTTQDGNVNVTLATIDQFSSAQITVPSSLVPAENLRSINVIEMIKNPKNGIIDISGILPTSETTFTLPTIKSVSIETKENAQLLIGTTFSYINPLPISAKVPYFGATVILDGNNFITFGITRIDLERNQGNMDISLAMSFDNSDGTKSAVNEFLKNILNGEVKQKIEISGIYFGGPNENPNDLMNLLKLPLPTDLVDINSIKNKVIELSPIKLPLSLDQLLSSQFMPQLKSVDISTLPNRVLSLKVGAQLNVPFEVSANIGYVGVKGITLDDKQFTSVDITGIQTSGAGINYVTLGIQLAFSDDESIQKSVKSIYDSLINGNFISTKGGINGVSLGISADDSIRTFEKISLSTEIGNLITGQLNLNGIIDSMLTNVGNSNNIITAGQGSITVNIPNLAQIVIGQLGIKFLPGKMIEIKMVSTITLSFTLTMNIGFAGVGIFLDDLSAFDIRVAAASEGQVVSIASSVKVNDSDELADKLGGLAKSFFDNTPLTGNLAIKNPFIGASNDDVIRAFSLISLDLSLEKLVTPLIKNLPKSIDPITLIDQIGFKLNALGIDTAPQHKILANVQASFNNNFPVTIDIGFVELSLGLDLVNFVDASLSDLSIGSGANNGLSIKSSLDFQPSNDQVQDKIASFVTSLQQNGLGKTNELFSVSGIKIGPSPNEFIKSFEKVVVGIPSSLILNQVVVEKLLGMAGLSLTDLTIEGMLNRLSIGNVAVDMNPNGQELAIKGNVGISNISLPLNVNMGILELSVALNASPLTRVILPDVKIVSSNNVISTDFTVALIFQDSDGLEDEVAALAKSLIEGNNGTVIPGNANINGLLFGSSNSDKDIINTFSKVLISLPLNPILQPIKAMITNIVSGFIDGTGAVKLTLDDVSVGIKNSNTLTTDIVADLTGLPQISLNIPFASVDVSINGGLFVSTVINGMKFEGNRFTTSVELGFQDNKQIANQLAVIISDLVFRRLTYTVSLPVGINNLIFGPSPQKTFGLTRKISVGMDVGKFINQFSDFNQKNNLITLENIQGQLTQQGVEAIVTSPAIPNLPLNLNIPSLLAQVFFKGVSGGISKAAVKPNVKKGQAKWEFGLTVLVDNGPMSQALETAVPNLLSFKSYTDGASLGGVILCTSDDCLNPPDNSFKIFNEINFVPPPLFLFNPINVELTKIFPTLGLNTLFTNTGPLHVDIGNFVLSLQSSGTSIFEVSSPQPVIIQNNLENAGKNVIPVEGKLTLDPLQIPKLLLDLVDLEKDFAIVLQVNKNGDPIGWLNDLLKNLPQTVIKNLFPILQGLLKNISIGIDLNNKNSTVPIGDGKTINGTVPIGDGKTPPPNGDGKVPDGKAPDGKIPDGKVPDDGSPKIPQGEVPKQPTEEEPKKPAAKDPQEPEKPKQDETPKQGKNPDGEDESIGGKIIDVITKPFRPKDSLTAETNDNIENPKPIYTWTINAPQ